MPSDRKSQLEHELDASRHENADLKKTIDLLSRQVYGRVMPGLYAIPPGADDLSRSANPPRRIVFPGRPLSRLIFPRTR